MYQTDELQIRIPRFTRCAHVLNIRHPAGGNHHKDFKLTYHQHDELYYINRTGEDVFIMGRDGVISVIPSSGKDSVYGLTIVKRKQIKVSDYHVSLDMRTFLAKEPRSPEASAILTELTYDRPARAAYDYTVLEVEYFIDYNKLFANKYGLYVAEIDLFCGLCRSDVSFNEITHPFSEVADSLYFRRDLKDIKEELKGITPYVFLMVVHDRAKYGARFIRIGGNVYRIPITTDKRLVEGFHLSTPRVVDKESETQEFDHRVIPIEDADKEFNLTRTYEDALLQESTLNNEVKFQEMEIRNRQNDLQQRRLVYEEENLRLTHEIEKNKRLNADLEQQYRNEMREYNRRREARQEWVDVLKTAGSFITTAFLLVKAFK